MSIGDVCSEVGGKPSTAGGDAMAPDFLTTMQAALGWKGFCVDAVPWCRYGVSTAMTIPLSEIHPVRRSQVDRVLRTSRCVLALFPTSTNTGVVCKNYVLRDKSYSEASLQRQFRQMLRRGEENLTFRALSWDEVATAGPRVLEAYRLRQGMRAPVARELWNQACEKGKSCSQFVVFGCHRGDELAGFEIFWRRSAGYESVSTVVHPGFFRFGAANLLRYRSARALITRSDCHRVGFGRSGIPDTEGNNRFNRHAGLVEEPLHMAAVLHPRLRWLGRIERSTSWLSAVHAALGTSGRIARHMEALAVATATDPGLLPE